MRVLIYPHDLGMGGSQINAIELAARVRDLGAETIVFGRPGVLCERIQALGLEFIESPVPGRRPSHRIGSQLRTLARQRKLDVLHGYEWPPSLECAAAAWGLPGVVAVSTVMSMAVPPFIPRTVPLIVGTEQIAAVERVSGRQQVHLLEPPVDLQHNRPRPASEIAAFQRNWGLVSDRPLLVCVTRLARELKSEGLFSAIEAVTEQLSDLHVQLLIVGDGPAREDISRAAEAANARIPGVVIMTGELRDPRAAYGAADVVLGMGGSALRALAFGKPLVVQGERGYFQQLDEQSWPEFAWQGWYGVGSGRRDGPAALAAAVRPLLVDGIARHRLGAFGRRVVTERFSLETAAAKQLEIYEHAVEQPARAGRQGAAFVRSGVEFSAHHARRKLAERLGRRAADDFNARPVAAYGPARSAARPTRTKYDALVYLAGSPWDAVSGTDVHLARELGRRRPVIWVDPPVSMVVRIRYGVHTPIVSQVAHGVTRIHPIAPPGMSRPIVRTVSRWWSYALVRHFIRRSGQKVAAVVASSPEPVLAPWRATAVHRIYFATDDFVAGAELLGISKSYLQRSRQQNLEAAQTVLAVTPHLADKLRQCGPVVVFPNGCDLGAFESLDAISPSEMIQLRKPLAGVIGQFNARLDLQCLFAVADRGISLLLIGPRSTRDAAFAEQFERLIQHPNVQWVGKRPAEELPSFLTALSVGLTPYVDNDFNRASFPLKTLEYLAAGLPVVSTALPAARSLDRRYVSVAASTVEFAEATQLVLTQSTVSPAERRAYASHHSWQVRAEQLDALLT
jgi:glycosyltransferase involved in cell wall biosynthesis